MCEYQSAIHIHQAPHTEWYHRYRARRRRRRVECAAATTCLAKSDRNTRTTVDPERHQNRQTKQNNRDNRCR